MLFVVAYPSTLTTIEIQTLLHACSLYKQYLCLRKVTNSIGLQLYTAVLTNFMHASKLLHGSVIPPFGLGLHVVSDECQAAALLKWWLSGDTYSLPSL